jgi:hypothetical protein
VSDYAKYDYDAVETFYHGAKFRSKLEAQWAKFFTLIGQRWEYEPEKFHLSSGVYIPDFYLPDLRVYVEIKPNADVLTNYDRDRYAELVLSHPECAGFFLFIDRPRTQPTVKPTRGWWWFDVNDRQWKARAWRDKEWEISVVKNTQFSPEHKWWASLPAPFYDENWQPWETVPEFKARCAPWLN